MADPSSDLQPLSAWPALAGLPRSLPRLRWERGVLGKEPGGHADFQWIAASPDFSGPTSNLARQLWLGAEDVVRATLLWRSAGTLHQAVHCYPGRAPDAHGRPFLEKQVLEWERPADLPAALGALILLPLAAMADDAVWQGGERDPFADHLFVTLEVGAVAPPDPATLAQTIRAGLADLSRCFTQDALGTLYARILAGHRAVFPPAAIEPLGPAALVAVLLPLPRELADRLSLVGWLPSTSPESEPLRRHWDLILGSDGNTPPPSADEVAPNEADQARGLAMAQAIIRGDPRGLHQGAVPVRSAGPGSAPERPPTRLTLWGPSGSGKTVFLGQLYWQLSGSQRDDWVIYPGETGLDFLELMRDTMYSRNAFPPGTTLGTSLNIVCHLVHRHTGERVTLALEDRAGADYEGLHAEVQERLLAADGIILLLDPKRQDDRVFNEVSHTFERLLLAAGRVAAQDPRPVAVCVTKADELIETPDDYRLALTEPAGFAAAHVDQRLLNYLETRFERFALFPVSAAGVRMQYGAIEPVVFYDEWLRPRINCGQPFNLLAPIDWLIRQVGS
ncbi:hypothetical protein [uncultured Thiodictyon sp.]|uniref:TRAFAC clade GTPase domain-containing protein n=1 Tax=uncultured Thiodictyon sp. TaxID=1846217 RepID=UPI002600A9DF|nr:hypothetical protein [uncultured Thiodictyon sp.]